MQQVLMPRIISFFLDAKTGGKYLYYERVLMLRIISFFLDHANEYHIGSGVRVC